jgi:hypothetical protein
MRGITKPLERFAFFDPLRFPNGNRRASITLRES